MNPCWIYGYFSYLLSTTAFLFSLAGLLVWLTREKKAALVMFAVGSVVTYFGHALTWALLMAAPIALIAFEPWVRGTTKKCATRWHPRKNGCIGDRSVVGAHRRDGHRRAEYPRLCFAGRTLSRHVAHAARSARRASAANVGYFRGALDSVVLAVVVVASMLLALRFGIGRRAGWRWCWWSARFSFFALPYEISKPTFFSKSRVGCLRFWFRSCRFFELRHATARCRPSMMAPVAATRVLAFALTTHYRDFDRLNRPFFAIVDPLPDGSSTLVVTRRMMQGDHPEEHSGNPATSAPAYWGYPEWPMALHGGFAPYVFDQGIPVRARRSCPLRRSRRPTI